MAINKKCIKFIIILIFISIIGVSILFQDSFKTKIIENELNKIYQIPINYTIEEAIKNGIIDVTNTSDENNQINKFLSKVDENKWSVLKTIKSKDNDLIITLYVFDNRINEIRTWKYHVKKQGLENADNRFKSYYILKDNQISSVYLKNIHNTQRPENNLEILEDEILYTFQ